MRDDFSGGVLTPYTIDDINVFMGKSMHLKLDGEPLNFGEGVLFAEADMTIGSAGQTRFLENPWIFRLGKGFGVVAEISDGSPCGLGFWLSEDLCRYEYKGILPLPVCAREPMAREADGKYILSCREGNTRFERETADFVTFSEPEPSFEEYGECSVILDVREAEKLKNTLGEIKNTSVDPVRVSVLSCSGFSIADMPRLTAHYSDGGIDSIPVMWNEDEFNKIDFSREGVYAVSGEAALYEPEFPFAEARPDPDIYKYNGKYYFVATDEARQRRIAIRGAESIEGLQSAPETVLFEGATLWAPELHTIGGRLCMLYAVGDSWDRVQSHVAICGGDPIDPDSWKSSYRVKKKDGSYLYEDGITLDLTYFESGGVHYYMWAQRKIDYTGGENHGSSDLYIAKIDPSDPTKITSEPSRAAAPRFGWDRYSAPVNEGPFAVFHGGRIYVTYSGNATDNSYALGLLSADENADLTNPDVWSVSNYPRLASAHVMGELGPGHNSFVTDENGKTLLVYHARPNGGTRSAGIRNVYWSSSGEPVLYMTPERYLKREFRRVTATVTVVNAEKGGKRAGYLYAYFRGSVAGSEEVQSVHLAISKDGLNWSDLNSNRPVISSHMGTLGLRDPYLFRSPEGKFYLLATDLDSNGGEWRKYAERGSKYIMVWESDDLVNWSEQRMVKLADESMGCTWAPVAAYDEKTGDYLVFWSSSDLNNGGKKSVYCAKTSDFKVFGEPRVFVDGSGEFTVIDSTVIRASDERYYRFTKREDNISVFMEVSENLAGPYTKIDSNIENIHGVEGANVFELPDGRYCLMLDGYACENAGVGYFPLVTDDISRGQFTRLESGFTPATGAKHGSIISINQKEYDDIMKKWGSARLTIDASQKTAEISPDMFGIFFEDINFGADGGLYAEVVENRSFECAHCNPDKKEEYKKIPDNAWKIEGGTIEFLTDKPLNSSNPTYAHIGSDGCAVLTNECYGGFKADEGERFTASLFARGSGVIKMAIVDGDNEIGSVTFSGFTDEFQKFTGEITAEKAASKAHVRLTVSRGTVELDMVSLITKNTFKNRENGLRRDLAEALAALHPGFMRFPGGCIIEGYYLNNRYNWKDSVGPVEARKENWNRWQTGPNAYDYCQTLGLGYYEYFLFCEDMGAKALPVLSCGIGCQFQSGEVSSWDDLYNIYIKDALDLIEFANGTPDENWREMTPDITDISRFNSNWANLRALMGHPESFNMEYLGIGNEQWSTDKNRFFERYEAFEEEIHARYPDIKLISSAGPFADGKEFDDAWAWLNSHKSEKSFTYAVDEHYYREPSWFFENTHRYDSYDRGSFAVFAGEYAANGEYGNTLWAALAEAAYLTGLEKNADIVKLASYAPLLARTGCTQWFPNLIWFDSESVYGSADYYTQLLYSNNVGTHVLKSNLSGESVFSSVSSDEKTGDIIIKLVNAREESTSVDIELTNADALSPVASEYVLTGKDKKAANSHENPLNVSVKEGKIENASDKFPYTAEPLSFTVLRLHRH